MDELFGDQDKVEGDPDLERASLVHASRRSSPSSSQRTRIEPHPQVLPPSQGLSARRGKVATREDEFTPRPTTWRDWLDWAVGRRPPTGSRSDYQRVDAEE
jgi:hypothetical protein